MTYGVRPATTGTVHSIGGAISGRVVAIASAADYLIFAKRRNMAEFLTGKAPHGSFDGNKLFRHEENIFYKDTPG